jgi:aspartyl-tRNA(Asn)/glutamyl-tRNA(Gln) amidotransferase subunit B
LIGELNYRDMGIGSVTPSHVIDLVNLVKSRTLTDKNAIEVLRTILDSIMQKQPAETPSQVVKRLDLGATDSGIVPAALSEVIREQPQAVADYASGKKEAFMFLIGQVMKKTRGKADPAELNAMLRKALEGREQ